MGEIWLPHTEHHRIPQVAHGPRAFTRGVVIHDIEGSAESALSWFAGGASGVGAHLVIGPHRAYQLAPLEAKCWHAVAANAFAIGIEHEGFTAWRRRDWYAHRTELLLSANRLAWICHEFGLGRPIWNHNVWTHRHGGAAWGGHSDPGSGFPFRWYIKRAREAYAHHWGRRPHGAR